MTTRFVVAFSFSGSLLLACGGTAPPATSPTAQPAPSASTPAPAPSDETAAATPVVRFDDLGVSLAVPAYMRVMGDDELATRIRTSANPRLTEELKARVAKKIGLPLLTLAKADAASAEDALGLLLIAAAVPPDSTAKELMDHELGVMKENLQDFSVDQGPTPIAVDGVQGAEIEDSYVLHTNAGPTKMRSHFRLFVRNDRAFTVSAVWHASAPAARELEAKTLLDGVRFYEPTP